MNRPHPYAYRRLPTRVVLVGDIGVGGRNPIRIQSMTTPATTDTAATVAQIERLVAAGAEMVRVTVPSRADAENLPVIRAALAARHVRVPLIADIHFTPAAAMLAVEHVEKVRVNPGNFADRKRFETHAYTDAAYAEELERVADRFLPLVRRARALGVSMRIGTNHGSLSDRVLGRHGDTPLGMVESALEFVRIAAADGYHDLILSMKSSNPLVAIAAYRLLVERMAAEGMDYPLHLGVTEAGDGEDGRIKSAIGIGALLDEGIGDTIRVSLTEDPVAEIPVAFALARPYNERLTSAPDGIAPLLATTPAPRPLGLTAGRRASVAVAIGPHRVGGGDLVRNETLLATAATDSDRLHREVADVAGWSVPEEKRAELLVVAVTSRADVRALVELGRLFVEHNVRVPLAAKLSPELASDPEKLAELLAAVVRVSGLPDPRLDEPHWSSAVRLLARAAQSAGVAYLAEAAIADVPDFIAEHLPTPRFEGPVETAVRAAALARAEGAATLASAFTEEAPGPALAARLLAARLDERGLDVPLVLIHATGPGEEAQLGPSIAVGSPLADGIGDAVRITSPAGRARDVRFTWDLLQAARQRVVKTEFISCPSCGRTLFDLEETTRRIKERTGHLKGLKIAIMGCVVNGPGEMADADFGYVGWGPGRVALFAGKTMVARDVPTEEADRRLVEIIREHGKWVDPR